MAGLPVVRVGDMCSGHQIFPPRPAMMGAVTVFCNGLPVVRVGDIWAPHPHTGQGSVGSPTVFCEGIAVLRVSDIISCGSVAATGSPDTFCG